MYFVSKIQTFYGVTAMVLFFNCFVFTVILALLCILPVNVSSQTDLSNYVTKLESKWKFGKLLNSIADVNRQRLDALKTYTDLDKYKLPTNMLRISPEVDPLVAVLYLNKKNPTSNKLYEIFDSNVKNMAGDTPVNDIVQQIKDVYGRTIDDGEIDDQHEDALKNLFRTQPETDISDGEEIPIQNNIQVRVANDEDINDGEEINSNSGRNIHLKLGAVDNNPIRETNAIDTEAILNDIGIPANASITNKKEMLRLFKSCSRRAVKSCKKACRAASKDVCRTYKCSSSMKRSFKKHCTRECKSEFSD